MENFNLFTDCDIVKFEEAVYDERWIHTMDE